MKSKNTTQKNATILKAVSVLILISTVFLLCKNSKADNTDSISQISSSSSETQKKLDELQKRAEIYRQIIDIKKKQGETLSDQLEVTAANIDQIQSQIDVSKQKIDDYNSQIVRLGDQISEKEQMIAKQKKMLTNLMQSFYEVNQSGPVVSYLSDGSIASFMVNKDRLSQAGDKISELVDSIKKAKDDLKAQSNEIDQQKTAVVLTHDKLQEQGQDLESAKKQRETLLVQTQGEEEKYKQLLARVEQQKQELLDIDQYFAASGLSVDSYPKPDSKYYASTDWYYSQRDPRWANENIGNTKTLMKSYGCAVTSVAMVFKEHGGSTDPGDLANEPIFLGDLINWPTSWSKPKVTLSSSGYSHGNLSWSTVDAQIAKENPVIVYIAKSKGNGGHYVVIHHKTSDGQYVVHDPYFGPNIYLNTSRALIGAMGKNSATSINQMIIYN